MSRRYFYQSLSLKIIYSPIPRHKQHIVVCGKDVFCARSREKKNNKLRAAQNDSKKIYPDFFQQQHISNPEKRGRNIQLKPSSCYRSSELSTGFLKIYFTRSVTTTVWRKQQETRVTSGWSPLTSRRRRSWGVTLMSSGSSH